MKVRDVPADSDVGRERNFGLVSCTQKRIVAMLWLQSEQRASRGFTQTDPGLRTFFCCAIENATRFFCASESSFG
jgi:hypothetical protein